LLCQSLSVSAFALVPAGNDATTKPDLYYLKNAQAIDSLALLPPPPEVGSIAFLNDQAMYEKGRLLRATARGKLAAEDANLSAGGVANAFSAAFGSPITEKDAPALHKLLTNMIEDAGDLATRGAKEEVCVFVRLPSTACPPAIPPNRIRCRKTAPTLPDTPLSAGPPPWCWLKSTRSARMRFSNAAMSSVKVG
jgi:hypothetical protein